MFLEQYGVPARERLQALLAEAKESNPLAPVTVVPPSAYAGISLRRVLAASDGLLNVRFMAFARLAEQLGAPAMAAQRRRPLSAAAEMAIIREVASKSAGHGVLGAVATHTTTHRSLQLAFQDMARLTDDELDALALADDLRHATVDLYRRYRERTAGYYRREDVAQAAAEAVTTGQGQPALQDVGALVFFLLSRPSPAEAALLDALSSAASCAMVVGRTGDPEVDEAEGRWWERLSDAVDGGGSQADAPASLAPASIVSAPDAREEVRQAAREMLRLAESGVPFHRMAALYRRPDPYAFQLQIELGFAGVPVAGPDPSPLRNSVPGRLLTGLLDVSRQDLGRGMLMQWLADAPVWNVASNRSASGELQRWEAISRQAGVVRGVEQWRERVSKRAADMREADERAEAQGEVTDAQARGRRERAESADRLVAFVEGLAQLAPPADGSKWSAFAGWAKDSLEAYAQGKNDWPGAQQEALERVRKALDELGKLDALEASTTRAAFQQALDHELSAPMGRTGATGTGVFVAGLGSAAGMEFDAVWVLGMSEGDYPARTGEDPLLPEAVRAGLPGSPLPLRREAQLRERRSYLSALAAGKSLRLSYSRVDPVQRRPQYPSPWLLDAASALQGERVSSERLNTIDAPWLTVIESMEDALRLAGRGQAADGHEFDLKALAEWRRVGGRTARHALAARDGALGRALAMDGARAGKRLTEYDGYVGSIADSSGRLGGSLSRVISPSRLETWATCPYRHFLGSVLGLSAWETPEDVLTISPMERGSLVHSILEQFIQESLDAGAPTPGTAWSAGQRARLMEIAEERFVIAEQTGLTGRRALWDVVKEDILQDLDRFLEDDARYRAEEGMLPRRAEYQFGFGGDAPVSLALPAGGEVRFRGFIDRVDATADGLRAVVMDYKTGSTFSFRKMKDDPLLAGKKLQLPIYALAVRETLLPDAKLRAEYWFVSSGGSAEHYAVDLDAVETKFRETVEVIATGVRGGVFPAVPGPAGQGGEAENCRFCDFKRVCPTNRQALWERKRESPEAAAYTRLGGITTDEADEDAE
ncbi:MAG: PD-(D/E)XK nuclease family protein [Chloroflexota bacterium]|nr:PD-(D/E)XK nuclease family protein [Chloroflexota bacterium]